MEVQTLSSWLDFWHMIFTFSKEKLYQNFQKIWTSFCPLFWAHPTIKGNKLYGRYRGLSGEYTSLRDKTWSEFCCILRFVWLIVPCILSGRSRLSSINVITTPPCLKYACKNHFYCSTWIKLIELHLGWFYDKGYVACLKMERPMTHLQPKDPKIHYIMLLSLLDSAAFAGDVTFRIPR